MRMVRDQLPSWCRLPINIKQNSKIVNAKSIMGMMTLGLVSGQNIDVEVDGEDEKDAMNGIEMFLLGR